MQVTRVFRCPITKILFIYCARKMKMRFIASPHRGAQQLGMNCKHLYVSQSLVNSIPVQTSSCWGAGEGLSVRFALQFWTIFEAQRSIDALSGAMFSGVRTFLCRPTVFLGTADHVARTLLIHFRMVLGSGTLSLRFNPNRIRKLLCVATTLYLFLKNVSRTKPRCSTDHGIVSTENGIAHLT